MSASFDSDGIDEISDTMKMIHKIYPAEVKKFLQKEGTKLKKRTLEKARSVIEPHTGNYFKGIKRGRYYKYQNKLDAVRVYAGAPAYHAHFVEYGHRMVTRGKKDTGLYVRGHRIFGAAADAFEAAYGSDCEEFSDKLAEALNRG